MDAGWGRGVHKLEDARVDWKSGSSEKSLLLVKGSVLVTDCMGKAQLW